MKYAIAFALLLTAAACAPVVEPICPREHQPWDKFGTIEDLCEKPTIYRGMTSNDGDGPDRDEKPSKMEEKDSKPTKDKPTKDKPVKDKPTKDKPTKDKPTKEKPVKDKPTKEKPTKDKTKGNNGWGNGDQDAPGKSKDKNNAENSDKEHHKHGKGSK